MAPRGEQAAGGLPKIQQRDWAARGSAKHIADVHYVGKMEAVVFRFADGRIFGVPIAELAGLDETPVTKVFVSRDGYEATILQFSGNIVEVPWDVVLHHVDPVCRYFRPDPGSTEARP